jgi:branched-chain amino acid aminotransferase
MPLEIRTTKTTSPKPHTPEADLGFGKHFSDHMLVIDYLGERGWHDARIEPYGAMSFDPAASALHYGQTLFEGLKAFRQDDGKVVLFRADAHSARMARGAPRLCMPSLEPADMRAAAIEFVRAERDWVPSSPGTALYLRPTIVATEAFLGVRPAMHYVFFTIASPVGSYYGGDGLRPVRIWVEREQVRAPKGGLGSVKAGANYAASLQAAVRAKKAGFDQVLWLDGKNHELIEEVGTMNLFVVLGDTLVTPPLSDSILAGVTRDCVLTLAKELGIRAEERPVSITEVAEAAKKGSLREVFGTGTAAVVSPVGELAIGEQLLQVGKGQVGEIARRLYAEITGIQRGTIADRHGWITPV